MSQPSLHDGPGATSDHPSDEAVPFLFVINSLGAGGAERSLADILPHLYTVGVRPIVACFKSPDVGFEQEVRADGTDVRVLPGASLMSHVRDLRNIIKRERPRLVYTALFDAHLAGRLAAAGTGVPVLSNLTNVAYDPARYADPNVNGRRLQLLRYVDGWTARHLTSHFHAVSGAVKTSAVSSLGVAPQDITVVHRGRHRQRLGRPGADRRARVRSTLGLDSSALVVITVGRQEYQKGQRYLLEAVPGLADRFPNVEIMIVGRQGHASSELASLVTSLDIEDRVRFLGHRDDVPDLLAASDVFAFPSVYEGLGGANIEAMALGLPLVASDIAALREVVEVGGNGILVPPADPAALENALGDLLADPDLRRAYGVRSEEIFASSFDAEQSIPRTVDLMLDIAKRPI
jgi:glycosyltransferase involved in cell wall biosynthesis